MKQNYTKTMRICDTSKWITHSTQNKTEGLASLILIGLCICFSFISCGKTEEDEEVTPPSEQTLELSDVCGVWTKSNNSLYYIAIYPNGKYSYCFNILLYLIKLPSRKMRTNYHCLDMLQISILQKR